MRQHHLLSAFFSKELVELSFSPSDHFVILYGAHVFERTPFVRAVRSGAYDFQTDSVRFGGGYRSRTDDPLLAKQVL